MSTGTTFILAKACDIQRPIVGLVALLVTPATGAKPFGILLSEVDAKALGKALKEGK